VEIALASTLREWIADRIRQQGKITFYEWMNSALYHPDLGYYARTDLTRWGKQGDYRTSPERSELFAAVFSRFFVSLFEQLGKPDQFHIVEFGAGNGRFASGVLDTLKSDYPAVFEVVHYTIVETNSSSSLETLDPFGDKVVYASFAELTHTQRCVVFSNELFDALAVHRLRIVDGQLKELYVALSEDGQFEWVLDELSADVEAFCEKHLPPLTEGQTVEVNLGIESFFGVLQSKSMTGYVVTVDYGAEGDELYNQPQRFDGTLRAYSAHQFVDDILKEPGAYDITSTIDWGVAKIAGQEHGFVVEEFAPLDKFLMRVGILEELQKRMNNAAGDAERSVLTSAAREMILPGGMASSFQVLVQRSANDR
jgi:SAM-dependent MidA family methyltransferase